MSDAAEEGSRSQPLRKTGRPFWTVESLRELAAERVSGDHERMADARAALRAIGIESWGELMQRAWGPL